MLVLGTVLLSLSVMIQIAAAFFAFRLIRLTGKTYAWVLITLALVLMAFRRIIPLVSLAAGQTVTIDNFFESVGLILSVFMLLGIIGIGPIFATRKVSDNVLELAYQRLNDIIEFLPDATFVIDREKKVIMWNRAIELMTGVKKKDILGRTDYSLCFYNELRPILIDIALDPDEAVKVKYPSMDIREHDIRAESYVPKVWGKKGAFCWAYASRLMDTNGNVIGAIESVRDTTDRQKDKEAMQELNQKLEERVRLAVGELREKDQIMNIQARQAAMGEMLGSIAHQWRQPLNVIGIYVQNIVECQKAGQMSTEYLETNVPVIMENIQHMSRTIDDFRNFFRPDKEKTVFSLNESMNGALSFVEASFRDYKVEIETVFTDEVSALGYPNEFAQALLNILNNALDAFKEKRREQRKLSIRVFREKNKSVISITDNAGGIPDNVIEKVFDPYFTTKNMGTGIGLYMTKTIIEKNMSGRLLVRNTGSGAEFRIELQSRKKKS